jgi:alpha-galactosidase
MTITYVREDGIFHLRSHRTSYVLKVFASGVVGHLYWGPELRADALSSLVRNFDNGYRSDVSTADFVGALDVLPQEYPTFGLTDFRPPAIEVRHIDGSSVVDLRYVSHVITKGKPKLSGLPATYVEQPEEAETLELVLADAVTGLHVHLLYTTFRDHCAIARSVRVEHHGETPLRLERILSFSVDLKLSGWDVINLSGSWARERHYNRQNLVSGRFSIESCRGTSSHQQSPFLAFLSPETTETQGPVYGLSFVYSGNFLAQAEVDQHRVTRLSMGLNPFDFCWYLEPGETFQAPEVVGVYASNGLGEMSRSFHALYRTRLARGKYRDLPRPILLNNWEATYFDFDADKIESIATAGAEAGIELFVLDDGWFGKRDRDDSSLGDWVTYDKKLPRGLKDLAERVHRLKMKFGLWFEPEMVSPDSELYRMHPDWCLHVAQRHRTQLRNQLVLDVSRADVRDYVVSALCKILDDAPIDYVKWDMNRPLTEVGSARLPPERQREVAHRHILGVYEMMERVTSRFPDVLFESCAGGGARFDGGMLYYMPQAWTSDDMDPVERLKIQWSTSLVFPPSSMGAHVCSSPNHTTGRVTPLATRAAVAMSGAFGYELDLTKQTEDERLQIKDQVAFFKEIRTLVQFGDFYRLVSPYSTEEGAWAFVARDKSEAFILYVRVQNEPQPPVAVLKLAGLEPSFDYEILGTGERYGGDYLMYAGIAIPKLTGDLQSVTWRLRRALAI